MTAIAAPALTPTLRGTARSWWFAVVVVVVAIGAALLAGLLAGRPAGAGDLDPGDAHPSGGRALAQVLQAQGVGVRVVDRLATAAAAPDGTVLVDDSTDLLTSAQWRRLAAAAPDLVVVAPSFGALTAIAPGVDLAGVESAGTVAAGCDLPLAQRAGPMLLPAGSTALRAGSAAGATACYGRAGRGQVVTLRRAAGVLTLLASRAPFENGNVARGGNAAVALTVLGAQRRLTWYLPSALDVPRSGPPTLADLTPAWVTPLVLLLLAAGVAAAFWRGRRLGPLVVERLPVVVRSRETVEGRARLYRRGGALLRAADALRMGVVTRLAPLVGLSRSSPLEDVVRVVARLVDAPAEAVRSTLVTAEPRTESDLVALSDDLARLERAVRAAVPGAPTPRGAAGSGAPDPRGAAQ